MESWKKSRLGQDSNSWSCNWIALCSTIELSNHPRAAHFLSSCCIFLEGAIWIVIYLTFHILHIYISYGQFKTNSESATLRKSRSLSGRAEFSAIARFWVRVLFKTVSFSVFSATALVVFLTAVIIRTSHCNLSLVVDEFSQLSFLKEVIHRFSLGILCIEELCTYEEMFFFL